MMKKAALHISPLVALLLLLSSCKDEGMSLEDIAYSPVPYEVVVPDTYPQLEVPADNPMTQQGVDLGRRLFYDPILSVDSTMSCASCHMQENGFTDNLAFSEGVQGLPGTRSSMSLLDVAFVMNGLFWDGRVQSLEDQALLPVEDPLELHHSWPDLEEKLSEHSSYPTLFRQAFGISNTSEIDRFLTAKAIAQFERSLVTSGQSKYDRILAGRDAPESDEALGKLIFFDEVPDLPDGQCFHCHAAPTFSDNEYHNNGIDEAAEFSDFRDLGLGGVTGVESQNGKFRTPTLRNIEHTAPYMHDGRFSTLEEVMDHYVSGGHFPSKDKSKFLDSISLDAEQKAAVIAFLKTLSDPDFLTDQRYSDPN